MNCNHSEKSRSRVLVDVVNLLGHLIIAAGDGIVEDAAHLFLTVTHLLLHVELLLLQHLHLLRLRPVLGQLLLHLLQLLRVVRLRALLCLFISLSQGGVLDLELLEF